MTQESLLLKFREKQSILVNEDKTYNFNIVKGLWVNKKGNSIISKLIKNHSTTKTSTREGIDQSETSDIGSTLLTKTRESIDQSEVSCIDSTLLTQTRESTDRSEISEFDAIQETFYMNGETTITFTRESVDQSECST